MQQNIRLKTFETNSSSMHSLILVDEDIMNKWVNKELWFRPDYDQFYTKENIIKSEMFKRECPQYDSLTDLEKEKAFDDYMHEYSDGDYADFYTYNCIDTATQTVYDENGNKKIAMSYYIHG